jgi:hypothetical protein
MMGLLFTMMGVQGLFTIFKLNIIDIPHLKLYSGFIFTFGIIFMFLAIFRFEKKKYKSLEEFDY